MWCSEADRAKEKFKAYEKANKSSAKKQKTDKSDKSDKSDKADKSDGASAGWRQGPEGGKGNCVEPLSRFSCLSNRMILSPSVYKKYCESVDRAWVAAWEVPVMFTGPDGASVFKVLDVGKYER